MLYRGPGMIAIKFNRLAICVVIVAFFGRAITQVIFSREPEVTGIYGGGVTLVFTSNFPLYPAYSFKSIYVDIDGTGQTIAAGGSTTFTRQAVTHFNNRLTAYQYVTQSGEQQFNLQITNVNFDDNLKITANVVYTRNASIVPNTVSATIRLVVEGGPLECGAKLPANTNVSAAGTATIKTVLCGKPIPKVTWSDDSKTLTTGSHQLIGKSKYNFILTLSTVTSSMCGMNISFVAKGQSGVDVHGKTKLNIIFKPSVTLDLNYRINSSCIRLEWTNVDIGTCTGLVYNIQYVNSSGGVISTTHHEYPISGYTHCAGNISGIKDTRIQASFNGKVGNWKKQIVSLVAPTVITQTPVVEQQTGDDDGDWKLGAILGGVIGGLLLILIILIIIWCCCWAWCLACCCCCCKDKDEKDEKSGVSTTVSSLGFHYKKNSKKKGKNGSVVVVPPTEPTVIYANSEKLKAKEPNELQFFDPTEFGVDTERSNTLSSQYNNTTYDDDGDDFTNKPSVLI